MPNSIGSFTAHDCSGNSAASNGTMRQNEQMESANDLIIVCLFISLYSVLLDRSDLDVENPSFNDLRRCSSAG